MSYLIITLTCLTLIFGFTACSRGNTDQIGNTPTPEPTDLDNKSQHMSVESPHSSSTTETVGPDEVEIEESGTISGTEIHESEKDTSKPGTATNSDIGPKSTPTPKPSFTPKPTPVVPTGIVNPYVPYTYDQMMSESQKLIEKYPEVISLSSIGTSVENRDILLVQLGKGDAKIILCGTHHAREYISSSYLMKMIEEYAKAYTNNAKLANYDVKSLLDQVTLYIVPMVNPDGVNLVNGGIDLVADKDAVQAMALIRPTYRQWKANINGVDLNRQYPALWEEKYDNVGRPASENYKGTSAATEPEVRAMMNLSEENEFILAASFHTKGNVIYWADEGTVDIIPGVDAMAKRLASLTKYQKLPVSKKPSVYGAGYENWFRLEFRRPAFCIELTPSNNTDVPHDDKKFDSLVWNNSKYIGLFLADEALKR